MNCVCSVMRAILLLCVSVCVCAFVFVFVSAIRVTLDVFSMYVRGIIFCVGVMRFTR